MAAERDVDMKAEPDAEAKRSKIWGGVIITLVAAIFAVGIFSAVKAKKEEDSGKADGQSLEIKDWNA